MDGRHILLFSLVGACGGSNTTPRDGDVADGSSCRAHVVEWVEGFVADLEDAPLEGANVQSCVVREDGTWLCLSPVRSDSEGKFIARFDGANACLRRLALRVLKTETGVTRATAYCDLDLTQGSTIDARTIRLPIVEAPTDVDGTRAVYASGLELDVGARDGAPSDLLAAVTTSRAGCGFDRPEVVGAIAFGPEGMLRDTRLRAVELPAQVADGTTLHVQILGALATFAEDGTQVDEGALLEIGQGVAREQRLELDLAFPYASWLVLTTQ